MFLMENNVIALRFSVKLFIFEKKHFFFLYIILSKKNRNKKNKNMLIKPGLYGINKSNRDFTKKKAGGKNQFNSSFSASLTLYMENKSFENVYITLDKGLY